MKKLFRRKILQRSDSKKELMEKNNNDIEDIGCDHACHKHATSQELLKLLGVCSDNTSEDGSGCSVQPELICRQENAQIIQKVVSKNFPKPPADLNKGLQQHLVNVLEAVINECQRLGPLMEASGLIGCLIDGCHRQTFAHLHGLLQNISSVRGSFMLMNWVRHAYLSQVVLGYPNHRLFTEWEAKAKENLLENAQKEVRKTLDTILENEKKLKSCDSDEAYVGLYIDIIQCITAMPREAQKISSGFCDHVREVCLKELLSFVQRYAAEQKEVLGEKVKSDQPETIYFLKTLKTCKELKHHIQAEGSTANTFVTTSLVSELVSIETSTLKLLMEVVSNIAESHLQTYFKSKPQRFYLLDDLEKLFPKLQYVLDEQRAVMGEAYKIIGHAYLQHLIQSSLRKLENRWSLDVGQTVTRDEYQLYNTVSDLAPGVHCNRMLLKIKEVLECDSIDMLKLIVAKIHLDCGRQCEDLELLSALLRWKGLSKFKVKEVMDALPDGPQRPSSGLCFSCLSCL